MSATELTSSCSHSHEAAPSMDAALRGIMSPGIIGKKIGMTQVFRADGQAVPVTVLQAGPCVVVQRKTPATDGYDAVQVGLLEYRRKLNKPTVGHTSKANAERVGHLREFKVGPGDGDLKTGDRILVDQFKPNDRVDVVGVSKGRGFAGTMKRHNFSGGPSGHGSMHHRAPGSIGSSSYPSRVFPGMRMAGHMGDERVTVRNLEVIEVDAEDNLILVKGAVPGPNGGYVYVRRAKR
jgi:large subunit ribosomal protein L3